MKRGWFNLLTLLSLLLAILFLVDRCTHPWNQNIYTYRSFRRVDGLPITNHHSVQTGDGVVIFCYTTVKKVEGGAWTLEPSFEWVRSPAQPINFLPQTVWGRLGFGVQSFGNLRVQGGNPLASIELTRRAIILPSWFLVVLFLVLPTMWAWKRRNKIPVGCCQVCGYDLRASPERCPECGTENTAMKASR